MNVFKRSLTVLFVLGLGAFFLGCRSNPKIVNSNYTLPISPMAPVTPEGPYIDSLPAGISGRVLLKAEVPRPLLRTRLALFKIRGDKSDFVTEISSDENGAFKLTRPLERGVYELKVSDPKYSGALQLTLTEKPATGLILEVTEASSR